MTAAKIENEINSYVHGFNLEQKKAALNAVKEIAEEKDESGYSEEFKRELDSRYEEYINGGELIPWEDVKKSIRGSISSKREK